MKIQADTTWVEEIIFELVIQIQRAMARRVAAGMPALPAREECRGKRRVQGSMREAE